MTFCSKCFAYGFSFNFLTIPRFRCYYCLNFTGEGIEAKGQSQVTSYDRHGGMPPGGLVLGLPCGGGRAEQPAPCPVLPRAGHRCRSCLARDPPLPGNTSEVPSKVSVERSGHFSSVKDNDRPKLPAGLTEAVRLGCCSYPFHLAPLLPCFRKC